MPSVFPYVLSFWMYIPLLLRIVVGIYFFKFGYKGLKEDFDHRVHLFHFIWHKPAKICAYAVSLVEIFGGIFLFLGLFVQPTVIVMAIITLTAIAISLHDKSLIKRDINIYILLTAILVSLFFLGPGYHAIDWPI